jgi:ketosteroid isomerase-like protein
MSQENVEVVRKALEASSRGDLDGFSEALGPAVEWTPVKGDPDYEVHRGIEAVRAWVESWAEAIQDLRWEAERILDAGGDQVAAIVQTTGRGAASGVKVEYRYGTVFTVCGGKIVGVREYASLRKALEAVGLRE